LTEDLDFEQRVGHRIAAFLNDEFVRSAFAKVEERCQAEWLAAETVTVREACWAKRRALEELQGELQSFVNAGLQATLNLDRLGAGKPAL
jgi:hypothetical protein